jgi:hypothetical protein
LVFLQVALNGNRQHDAAPKSPEAIGIDAVASVKAGAHSVHVHGLRCCREGDIERVGMWGRRRKGDPCVMPRCADIAHHAWTDFPELVTANQGEAGIVEPSNWLL